MNWKEGVTPSHRYGETRDMTVFVDHGNDVNNDGVDDAYAIYSSEMNAEIYISLLNSEYTGPAKEVGEAEPGIDYNYRVLPDQHREAPSVFYYDGYYYMLTSGTDGWNSTDVIYYRSKSMILPEGEQWEKVGDPFAESGTKGYDSQPTHVITVDPEKGQFIYMGDRWRVSSNGSAGPDSRYVWLPIEFGSEDDIIIKWYDEWDLSALENEGKIKIVTELPNVVRPGEKPELPEEIEVIMNAKQQTVPVEWQIMDDLFENPGSVSVVGKLVNIDREVSHNIQVIPANVVYFVNPSHQPTEDYLQMISHMKDTLLNKDVRDQPYDPYIGNTWGFSGGQTTVRDSGNDIFETFRYVIDQVDKNINYTFEIDDGNYTIYAGFYDPWHRWADGNRKADVFVNDVLVDFEYTYSGEYDVRKYENIQVTDGKLELKVEPSESVRGKNDSDSQISWIMIVDNFKELRQLLSEAKSLLEDGNEYTEDSLASLSSAIKEAEALLDEEKVTQAEINEAVKLLQEAIENLEVLESKDSELNATEHKKEVEVDKNGKKLPTTATYQYNLLLIGLILLALGMTTIVFIPSKLKK